MKKASLCIAAAISSFSGFAQLNDGKPNIIFFLVDDMGWQETSVPFWKEKTMLNERYHTPNMEVLASQGMKFTQAYACPLCSPTRVSLMTGMNAARHGVTNWTLRKNISPDQIHKILEIPSWNVNGISPFPGIENTRYVKALPMFLKEAAYTTIHVGKAHWGAKGTPGEDPLKLGFDVNVAGHAGGGPGSYYGKFNFSAAWRTNPPDTIWDVPGLKKYHGKDINLTEALTLEAMTEMEKAVKKGTPFYLYMANYAVHAPWEKDERFYQRYIDMGLNDFEATLASMIESMDKSLGDLMAKVKQLGIEDNTVIIFMSDNGSPSQCPQNKPLRGHKIDPYEGGIRDPMLVKWPGVVKAGSVCSEPLIIEDFFPSILEIAGVKKYKQPGGKIDGISFVPMLLNKKVNTSKRSFFWHFPHNYGSEPYSVIREGNWKLIYWYLDGKTELYNIPDDINESKDLSSSYPEISERLAKKLGSYLKSVGAKTPVDKVTKIARPFPGDPWTMTKE
jgi:arylsulfatase A-like enzyme